MPDQTQIHPQVTPTPESLTCSQCGQPCHPTETQGCDTCLEARLEAQAEAACQGDH